MCLVTDPQNIQFIICSAIDRIISEPITVFNFLADMFGNLGPLPAICKGHLSPKFAPNLMNLVNGTLDLKTLCANIDVVELGEDIFKLNMLAFEKDGAEKEVLQIYLPMFQLFVKVLAPIESLPGLSRPVLSLLDDLRVIGGKKGDELFREARNKTVYQPIMKFLMDVRIQELVIGMTSCDVLYDSNVHLFSNYAHASKVNIL